MPGDHRISFGQTLGVAVEYVAIPYPSIVQRWCIDHNTLEGRLVLDVLVVSHDFNCYVAVSID